MRLAPSIGESSYMSRLTVQPPPIVSSGLPLAAEPYWAGLGANCCHVRLPTKDQRPQTVLHRRGALLLQDVHKLINNSEAREIQKPQKINFVFFFSLAARLLVVVVVVPRKWRLIHLGSKDSQCPRFCVLFVLSCLFCFPSWVRPSRNSYYLLY